MENKEMPPVPTPSQEDLNIAAYARVFEKCLAAAGHMRDDVFAKTLSAAELNVAFMEIAKTIFREYWEDQRAQSTSMAPFSRGLLEAVMRMQRRI